MLDKMAQATEDRLDLWRLMGVRKCGEEECVREEEGWYFDWTYGPYDTLHELEIAALTLNTRGAKG